MEVGVILRDYQQIVAAALQPHGFARKAKLLGKYDGLRATSCYELAGHGHGSTVKLAGNESTGDLLHSTGDCSSDGTTALRATGGRATRLVQFKTLRLFGKMQDYVQKLTNAGMIADTDAVAAEEILRGIPTAFYRWLPEKRPSSFTFLSNEDFPSALAFIRALALAEKKKYCPFPGSVSLLIPAFFACHRRSEPEVAMVADWIVTNHENPYTPFNFRRTRVYWETAQHGSPSPVETLRRVRQMEREEAREKVARAKKHQASEGIQRLHKGQAPDSPALRDQILHEMEKEILDE